MKKLTLSVMVLVIALAILAALAYGIVKIEKIDQKVDKVLEQQEFEPGRSTQDSTTVLNLIGTGTWYGNGIATSTDAAGTRVAPPTIFQFNSSTNDLWWNTTYTNYPHTYGPTPTAAFLINGAEAVTFDVWYQPTTTDSFVELRLFGSNDDGCNNASSTLNLSHWFSMPVVPTTSPAITLISIDPGAAASTTLAKIAPGALGVHTYSIALPEEWLNFNCLQLQAFNSSTTDVSLLWVEVSILR